MTPGVPPGIQTRQGDNQMIVCAGQTTYSHRAHTDAEKSSTWLITGASQIFVASLVLFLGHDASWFGLLRHWPNSTTNTPLALPYCGSAFGNHSSAGAENDYSFLLGESARGGEGEEAEPDVFQNSLQLISNKFHMTLSLPIDSEGKSASYIIICALNWLQSLSAEPPTYTHLLPLLGSHAPAKT